jgi:hypothetical protein
VRIPDAATRKTIAELEACKGKRFTTVEALMKGSLKKRKSERREGASPERHLRSIWRINARRAHACYAQDF